MRVQFDWQAGDEEGRWETIATTERRAAFRVPRRIWSTLLLAAIVVVVGGALGVRFRYLVALRRLKSDLQTAIDLETWALKQHDRGLFMAQQDESVRDWYEWQVVRFLMYHNPYESKGPAPSPGAVSGMPAGLWARGLHPEVTRVRLHRDVAWVEVIGGDPLMRHVRFYRRTDDGWVHTAPRSEFRMEPIERRYGSVTVRAQPYDLAHVEPLVEHVSRVVDEVSAALDHRTNQGLEVDFVFQDSPNEAPILKKGRLLLPSPWLIGIPVEGAWDPEVRDTLDSGQPTG